MDVENAFDTVWYNGIIFKLIQYNWLPYIIILIGSYFTEKTEAIIFTKNRPIINKNIKVGTSI